MTTYIKKFNKIGRGHLAEVGGKNASLGEMYNQLASRGIMVPNGFATTSRAIRVFLEENNLEGHLMELMQGLDRKNFANLAKTGATARKHIASGRFSETFIRDILNSYRWLCGEENCAVAVRSSATAEDLPDASFAGQHDSFLNISNETALLQTV
jgi:pyruvate,water dikinase